MSTYEGVDPAFIDIYEILVENLLQAQEYLEAFDKYDVRTEGWITGQLIKTINANPRPGWKLLSVGKEVGPDRQRPDMYVDSGGRMLRIEIKCMVVGSRQLSRYMALGFGDDLSKLESATDPMCLLTVAFPILDESAWKGFTEKAFAECGAVVIRQADVRYGRNRKARIDLWKKG